MLTALLCTICPTPMPDAYTVTLTLTDEEPNPEPEYNGTAVTVQVYVDGVPVTNPLDYVSLDRNTEDTTRDLWEETVGQNGIITCGFNFNTNKGHDCVDIDVKVTNNDYVLQGISPTSSLSEAAAPRMSMMKPAAHILLTM